MKKEDKTRLRQAFEEFDKASSRRTEIEVEALEAERQGKIESAYYLRNKVLPTLRKEAFKSFIRYDRIFNELYNNGNTE